MRPSKNPGYSITVDAAAIMKGLLLLIFALLSIFSLTGLLTSIQPQYRISSNSVNHAAENVSGAALYSMFSMENTAFAQTEPKAAKWPSAGNMLMKLATNISLKDPRSLLGRELPGFSIFDSKILVAGKGTNYTNMPIESIPPAKALNPENDAELQNTDSIGEVPSSSNSQPPLTTNGKQKVYVYFTHTNESYLPYLKGVTDPDLAYHSKINVTKLGDELKTDLEDLGIGTKVDKTNITSLLNHNGLSYASSYKESRTVVASAMNNDHDLQYFIDIHRDSRRKKYTTIGLNGKEYAKIAFVIGAENPNYEKNAKLAAALHKIMEKKYPGISRGLIMKQGADTNGKFNQDLSPNSFLIEVGGVDNTFEEMDRTIKAFADVFAEYYWQAAKVNSDQSTPPSKQ
ncbi:stage II sporulation protein P [Falsibacillus albus]|uniref:Stage II sporulation protein P n=1 Tax=Falsibacillus albus TaxID=2478915 RepID=A0A3L7K512_9BACI|nr:stage II sporulation protein P [Falsibacillus albus]RLQ98163.1 stage II sporulation protein P [Falsibacillus albus]